VRPAFRRALIVTVIVLIPVVIHGVWDQIEATRYAREIAAIAARGEPVSLRDRTRPLPTSDEQRAARLYAAAATLTEWKHRDDPLLYSRERDVDKAFESGSAVQVLDKLRREYVDGEPALDLLSQASALPFRGFGPIGGITGFSAFWLADLSALNCLHVDALTAERDSPGAANALMLSIRLQRTMRDVIPRSIATRRLYGSLRLLLAFAPPDSATLLKLQQAFASLPDSDDIALQLENQRARLLGDTFWPYPPAESPWMVRLKNPEFRRGAAEGAEFVVFRPWYTHVVREEFAPYADAIRIAREPWPQKVDDATAMERKAQGTLQSDEAHPLLARVPGFSFPHGVTVFLWLPSYLAEAGLDLTMRRTALGALAAERYRRDHGGEPPNSLDALVPAYLGHVPIDPYSGTMLKYRRDADSYVVYGVDANRTDDGGVLYGFASGNLQRTTPSGSMPRDIGIRVPLIAKR
jgi:hypothetical protein